MKIKEYNREPDTSFGQWYNTGEIVCQREALEEVGLKIPLDEIKYATSISMKRPDGVYTFINSYFVILPDDDEQEVVLGNEDEVVDYAWVTLEEAKEYDLLPGVWEEIEMVDNIIKKGSIGAWKRKH